MGKIRRWVNELSVKAKLVFYGYMTITPVLVLISIVYLLHNYQKVTEERLDTDLGNVNTLAESVHVLQLEIKDFSTYICINDDIKKLLQTDDTEQLNANAMLWSEKAPMQIVQDMIALKGHIKTIAIYPENSLRPFLRGMDGSVNMPDIEAVRETAVYQETRKSENAMLWKYVSKGRQDTYLMNRDDKVVLYREILDLAQKKSLGYIVIGVSKERFQELCVNMIRDEREGIVIIDPHGGELSRAGTFDGEVEEYLKSEEFIRKDYRERESLLTIHVYDIICSQVDKNTSIVCKAVPHYNLQMQILDIAHMPLMLLAGMMVGLLPLLLIISNIVTEPLQKVSEAIQLFSVGDFEQRLEIDTNDEIGEVARCFNKMVEDIRTLIDENYVITLREKESELAALQAQINPHFLYNTLNSLYWKAMEEGNGEIAESILALSQLFRLVLNQRKKEVTAGQEIELISRYLQIQKVRFSKRLHYEIVMEESVKKAIIPKLIIQPFEENAIVHGFENVTTPCYLKTMGMSGTA
ncbi:MAG: histidine kinase [Schaedlerella sp.]|uniref:sensor histidine kinase n=1 Tax=Schaedlerella sp. TaxID=2676057 RepID=UPI00272A3120|nr:histidine kinase [uncultured Schaedlerella sp.]